MLKKIRTLINYISNCKFFSKDGYYHLPYLADSPQRMLEGFKSLPFTKTDESKNLIVAANPWIDIKVRYIELETGLWLMINDASFKADVCTYAIYEQAECDYYSLYYYTNKRNITSNYIRSMNVELVSKNWTLHAPKSKIEGYISKGTNALFFSFYFDRNWVKRNINYALLPDDNQLKNFFNTDAGTFICNAFNINVDALTDCIFEYLDHNSQEPLQILKLKNKVNELILNFIKYLDEAGQKSSTVDYKIINKIEIELDKTLKSHFPGLEKIAEVCNCSKSKLKYAAKEYYGRGLGHIHQQRRMEAARQLVIKNKGKNIKEIAFEFGYESQGKFSMAYKKNFGYHPSKTTLN